MAKIWFLQNIKWLDSARARFFKISCGSARLEPKYLWLGSARAGKILARSTPTFGSYNFLDFFLFKRQLQFWELSHGLLIYYSLSYCLSALARLTCSLFYKFCITLVIIYKNWEPEINKLSKYNNWKISEKYSVLIF